MLEAIGVDSPDALVAHIPNRLDRELALDAGKSEYEIADWFRLQGDRNSDPRASFLGAGAYAHYRPVLIDTIVSRGEFLTSYTPYQAEISQGTLTTIFEFQTMVCQLTGMDVANASMYDGSTAIPEAALMAMRITGRDKTLVARTVHPEYREVLTTYGRGGHLHSSEFGYVPETGKVDLDNLASKLGKDTAAVIVQSPNFFGVVEDIPAIAELVHSKGAMLVVSFTEAVSLGLLRPPVEADIVCGELQSFAHPPSYGGPFAGVIASKEKYVRQLPGRLVGETKDASGRRAFCLTLATREQHIRREKATSNICTNQALVALMATVFMTVYGKQGLRELAMQNLAKTGYLESRLGVRFAAPYFNEFVTPPIPNLPKRLGELRRRAILGGLPLERHYPELEGSLLVCATEMTQREHMDELASILKPEAA
jgi:glycine dehydrogenase subunit 1